MKGWVIEQGLGHVGRAIKQSAAFRFNQLKGMNRVEVLLQNDAATMGE